MGSLPDSTFVFLIDPDTALARRARARPDRIESEDAGFMRRVDAGYRELVAAAPAGRRCSTVAAPDELAARVAIVQADPREQIRAVPEQPEAKRLLDAALDEGPAHAYLFHGPPGVGKRRLACAFARELVGDERRARRIRTSICSSRSAR